MIFFRGDRCRRQSAPRMPVESRGFGMRGGASRSAGPSAQRLDLIEPDLAVGEAALSRFRAVTYLVAPHPRLGGASIGRRGGGEFGWTADGWGRSCRSSCRRSPEVEADRGSGMSRRPMLPSLQRERLRSRWCCQREAAVCSCPAPVGRRSLGWMPYAARHTATSPMRATLGWLPRVAPERWRAVLVSVSSDMSAEVGDQSGALGEILAPSGMIMKLFRNAGKPG